MTIGEPDREIRDDAIELSCRLYDKCPVQAEGTIRGRQLYFRARNDEWTFSVSESDDVDPVDIQRPGQGFFRSAPFGNLRTYDASWMQYDVAEEIIRQCAYEYVNEQA